MSELSVKYLLVKLCSLEFAICACIYTFEVIFMKVLKTALKIFSFWIFEKLTCFSSNNGFSQSSSMKCENRLPCCHHLNWNHSKIFFSWKYKSERVLHKRDELVPIFCSKKVNVFSSDFHQFFFISSVSNDIEFEILFVWEMLYCYIDTFKFS